MGGGLSQPVNAVHYGCVDTLTPSPGKGIHSLRLKKSNVRVTMQALLLVAHGSKRKQSNDEVVVLAGKLEKHCADHYGFVNAAFLEAADVLIPDGIQHCVNKGASSIIVLPCFLNSGKHVVEDIPRIVNSCKDRYPDIDICIAPHIGASPLMIDLLLACADTAKTEPQGT